MSREKIAGGQRPAICFPSQRPNPHAAPVFFPVHAGSYAQRPHFMVRAWLDWGVESALWVNPYPCRLPRWDDLRRGGHGGEQVTRLDPRVHVLDVPALPIEPLPLGAWLNRCLLGRDAWRRIERFRSGRNTGQFPSMHSARKRAAVSWRRCAAPVARRTADRRRPPLRPGAGGASPVASRRPAFSTRWTTFPSSIAGSPAARCAAAKTPSPAEVDLVVASSTFLAGKFARPRPPRREGVQRL